MRGIGRLAAADAVVRPGSQLTCGSDVGPGLFGVTAAGDNSPVTVDAVKVDAAARRLNGVVERTNLEQNRRLSQRHGAHILVKREDLQTVRSYKVRGAYNLISQLTDEARASGVVAASAGNHAQGLARACSALGVRGRVYLPSRTPQQKRDRIGALGGPMVDVVLGGDTYDEASAAATQYAEETGATVVPAFNDDRTVAGQGTVVREVVEQLGYAPDVVLIPVGGGGLLAGSVAWLSQECPRTRVIGVEPAGAASVAAAMDAGEPVTLSDVDTFVDGAAVRRAGEVSFGHIRAHKPELMTVPEGAVCSEMLELYQSDGVIAEPAGAMATAALSRPELKIAPESTVVCIISGGNNDVSRYAEVVERALVYEGRKHYFLVEFPQEPGALRRFLDQILGPNDDIALFEYVKRSNRETGPALVGIELSTPDDLPGLLGRMETAPHKIEQIDPQSSLFRYLL